MFKRWNKPKDIVKEFEKIAPDQLTGMDVVRLMTATVLTYARNEREAGEWTMMTARAIRQYYTDRNDGECTCDKCIARRKSEAH